MDSPSQDRSDSEIQQLQKALDAETQRGVDLQRQLDRANGDFEEFVSRAAHDLRESLRDISAFSQLMAETDSGEYLERIRNGAERMQSLLAAIVDYWSIGAAGPQPSPTDMEAVLEQALHRAAKQIAESGAIVTHDPLPRVCGDFDSLAKVLHHLIGNAIEYCGTPVPLVHISSKQLDLEWLFSVRDNGPGIERAFHERIFGTFKRLHGRELPGNGLGLAFCKKALEFQGGRIWVESAPGAGSTFCFTLLSA